MKSYIKTIFAKGTNNTYAKKLFGDKLNGVRPVCRAASGEEKWSDEVKRIIKRQKMPKEDQWRYNVLSAAFTMYINEDANGMIYVSKTPMNQNYYCTPARLKCIETKTKKVTRKGLRLEVSARQNNRHQAAKRYQQ